MLTGSRSRLGVIGASVRRASAVKIGGQLTTAKKAPLVEFSIASVVECAHRDVQMVWNPGLG